MNKIKTLLLLFVLIGCDTSNNITPLGEEYFIKFYGATGYQEGVSVQPTPDGGFIIGGNSIAVFGGTSDYLLIKVDAAGNEEWQQTYDFEGAGANDDFTDVLVDGDSYIIAGTSSIGGVNKMVLLRVALDGTLINSSVIFPTKNNSYKANGISKLSNGGFLVTGPIVGGDVLQNGKSLITVINSGLTVIDSLSFPSTKVNPGEEKIFVKAIEVVNHFSNPISDSINYLIFGYENTTEGAKLNTYQFKTSFATVNNPIAEDVNNSRVVDVVKISSNTYKFLSASDNETYLINVTEKSSGYSLGSNQVLRFENFITGASFAKTEDGKFLISADITPESTTITSSSVLESSAAGTISWQRFFGTEISYKSGKVIALDDGSVVYTGTAGFKGQDKVFLIKLKSNGEMK